MRAVKWFRLATEQTSQFDRLAAELAEHQVAEPKEPAMNAANLLIAMQVKGEFLRERIAHSNRTQQLLRAMFEQQQQMLRHLQRAPDAVQHQAQDLMGA